MLPFDRSGKIMHGTTEIADVDFAAWPTGEPAETANGEAYDFTGEAPAAAGEYLVGQPNRILAETDGEKFKVVGAALNKYVPHVELQLRVVRGG